ncbi:hypothetical protein HNR51_001311 [Methylorubrum thiocyanatum]|uniref:Uncharacterized protein n=1 Tax=Methylorubrum thiocyanatum TaxID=47958 RepID=A0AA40S0J3_9HYPH|nr:hypothetical protein [Methylorubrum thiocyanatum]GJE81038.1 hypothetical protein CJNNKLLH_2380 [Methylorubrum thiocyanatum]
MYQVVGFVAVGAAGAAVLHSWGASRFFSFGFLSLNVFAAGLAALAQTAELKSPREPIPYNTHSAMPPTAGFVAPPRIPKPQSESPVW